MGNRTQKADSATGTENYSYNAANMLLTRGSNSYSNDLNGNTLSGGGRTNSWDSQNRLVGCSYSGNSSSYVYGWDGLRRRANVNGTVSDFVLDGAAVVRELRGSVPQVTYLQGASGPVYRRDDTTNTVRWYLFDGLGSVLGEMDPGGNVTASSKYDVYGAVRSRTGTATTAHGFVGSLGHTSETGTGLIYMRARYMDPASGTFLSQDRAKADSNWFCYCSNDPINKTDVDGLAGCNSKGGTMWPGSVSAGLWLEAGAIFWLLILAEGGGNPALVMALATASGGVALVADGLTDISFSRNGAIATALGLFFGAYGSNLLFGRATEMEGLCSAIPSLGNAISGVIAAAVVDEAYMLTMD